LSLTQAESIELSLLVIIEILGILLTVLLFKRIQRRRNKKIPFTYELGLFMFFLINVIIWFWDVIFNFLLVPWGIGFETFSYNEEIVFQTTTLFSLIILIYILERIFWPKIKHLISILSIFYILILTITGLFMGFTMVDPPFSTFNLPIVIFLPFVYLYLAIKGSSAIRKSSFFFFIGFGGLLLGGMLRYRTILHFLLINPGNELFFHLFSPSLLLFGMIVILTGFFKIKNYLYIPIESIHVFNKRSGIPLFVTCFEKGKACGSPLLASGLIGITHFIKEITKHPSPVRAIKQEDMNILLDYGKLIGVALLSRENLGILHQKLKTYLIAFETQYEKEIVNWNGDVSQFNSSLSLVNRIFESSFIEEI